MTLQGQSRGVLVQFGGLRILAFDSDEDEKGRRRGAKPAAENDMPSQSPPIPRKSLSPGVGNALREAYQEALREDVPPEMLDLLGKLG